MLEAADPIFSTKDTYRIMHYLETQLVLVLERSAENSNDAPKLDGDDKLTADENIGKMVTLIRRACTRNLSRALSIENTIV